MTNKEFNRPVVYRTKFPWTAWLLLFLCVIGVIAAIPLGYLSYIYEIALHGTARSLNSLIPFICAASLFTLCALFVIIRLIVNKPVEITFEPEFVQISHKGRKLQIVYAEVQQIFRRDEMNVLLIFPVRKREIKIQTSHGIAKIEGNIKHYDAMVTELENRVYPIIYLHCQDLLVNKKVLKFDTLLVNQRGIKLNENIILWNQVASVTVVHGNVVLKYWLGGKIQEQKFLAGAMPNLPVFLKLAEENIHLAGNV